MKYQAALTKLTEREGFTKHDAQIALADAILAGMVRFADLRITAWTDGTFDITHTVLVTA